MRASHLALGAAGEELVAQHLARRGWRILARNARAGGVEIDLVVARGGVVAFVEVKTRRSRAHGAPEEAVDARKRARLARAACAWLRENRPGVARVRFDVAVCEPDTAGGWRVRHLEGAFDAGD
jgi:putative endonuclease